MNQNTEQNKYIEPNLVINEENSTELIENRNLGTPLAKSIDTPAPNEAKLPESGDSLETNNADNRDSNKSTEIMKNDLSSKLALECDSGEIQSSQQYDPENVRYEGDIAIYTDKNTGYQYQWNNDKNEWVIRNNVTCGFEDGTHIYTDSDGTKFFWDNERNAWFPKLDEDFMAKYQMSYGFSERSDSSKDLVQKPEKEVPESKPEQEAENVKLVKGEKRKASEPTWFEVDETQNTNVYVSNLPLEMEEQEFVDFMQKCGLVMRDPSTGKFKVKLYREAGTNYLKGDALCTYIRIESVDLALNLLDGCDYKGHKIKVEKAKFELKGHYDPKLKPKMRKKKEKLKLKKAQEKLFDWRPEKKLGDRSKHERVVIIKNLFEPTIFDTDVSLILEFQQDLREEASKIGEVRKVLLYDRHPEGIAQITMSSPEEADQVVTVLNRRWFMKRQLTAEIWDGKTKYKIAETDSQISQRLDGWDKFLEGEDELERGKIENKNSAENVNDVDNKNNS